METILRGGMKPGLTAEFALKADGFCDTLRTLRMSKIRMGVIGAGWWATFAHLPAIRSHPEAELVAVQSRDYAMAGKIARDFGAIYACSTIEELLAIDGLDAVVIASTPNVHFTQAKAALDSGRHVLIEKPMTFTAAEAQELVELAAQRKMQLLISCPWHFTRHGIASRELIRSGGLGEIKMISVLMTNPIEQLLRGENTSPTHGMADVYVQPGRGSYNNPAIAGGGQIYCQVSHAAAYLTFLTGLRPAEVFARFNYDGSPNDIYNALTVTLENGALVALASTGATPQCERNYEVRLFGSRAILQLELWRGTMTLIDFDGKRTDFPSLPENEIYPAQSPAQNFIDAILGKTANGSPGELGLASMEIIEAACRSATTNHLQKIRPTK